ncbi:unnamed protein product [Anisakis simplex]|uniref:P-type domain-containing protein n=1 Tax=Anisakis simplex TaxID=6269 RepID=A0A0M3KCN6_ANISI|nr:unnamed protein product [Anisakis simplex]
MIIRQDTVRFREISEMSLVENIVPPGSRVTCTPDITHDTPGMLCLSRGCIYDPKATFPTPSCYFPCKSGYVATSVTRNNGTIVVKLEEYKKFKNPFGNNYPQLTLTAKSVQKTTMNIRIAPKEKSINFGRYEPNLDMPRESVETGESFIVETSNATSVFSFKVIRTSTKEVIWDTSIGGLMFADQYIQIAAYLDSSNIYGLGESYDVRLRHILQGYQTWAMFARDERIPKWGPFITYGKKNLYGAYPFYMAIERDGKTHGVLFLNSNAQEVTLGPHPQIIYRTIGGILDVYFFPGPKPEDVIRQYLAYVGRPVLPPYWALGQQISRPGLSLEELSSFVQDNKYQSVVHINIDYMKDYQEFTLAQSWQNLSNFIEQLHRKDIHAVIEVGPVLAVTGEAFLRARNARADFFEWQDPKDVPASVQNLYNSTKNTKIMLGVSWPNVHVAFPNYDSTETMRWWSREIQRFQEQVRLFNIFCINVIFAIVTVEVRILAV